MSQSKDRNRALSSGQGWPGSHAGERARKPANVPALFAAVARIQAEAGVLAERAYEAIQHHAYDPYREFCEKRAEHAALVSVLRGRIGPKPENPNWIGAANRHDRALLTLSIQACVKFSFALSATPLMPMGARETFLHEVGMLRAARQQLLPVKQEEGVSGLLDELEMALMILEEIVDRAPALEEF